MSDKRISQLVARVTLANNDVFPIVASGAATTNKVTLQTIDDYMQTNLDFGVTSVAMSVPTGLTVTGSPITSTGTFVVTFTAGYSIPTTAKQTQWDTAYTNRITSATAPLGIASNVISITQSGVASNGYLSSTDWNTFNNKQATITTGNLTESTSSVLTITGGTSSVLGSGTTIQVKQASGSQNGFISSTDWTIFNGKQNSLGGTGIVKSVGGTISYLTDSTSNWDAAYNDKINSAAVTGTTTKTLTLTQQDGGTILATWTDDNTDAVTSVFGRTGAVVANSGDYNTSQVTENTNLYYTDTRARLALSGSTGISYNNTTGNISSTITQYTDALARAAISESVTGLDYNNTTGVLSTTAGYGIPTTASQTNWDAAYNDKINSAAVSGTTTKTLTLTQQDGGTITASWTDINTDAVTSVFGRTGAVVAVSGDYTTAQVTESGNLYYTDTRARLSISASTGISYNNTTGAISSTITQYTDALSRAALSFVAGSGAYNGTTGVITIPTNNNQITNGANYITSYTETDTLASVTGRGASTSTAVTLSGGATITGLTIAKSGTDSIITFPAQQNDPAYIKHYESNNTAIMYFVASDDANDYFHFGYTGNTGAFQLRTDGVVTLGAWQGTAIADTYISSAATWNAKQAGLSGTGFVKITGTTISYDNSTYYLASNPSGYISSYTETDTLSSVVARGSSTTSAISAANFQQGFQALNLDAIKTPGLYHYDGAYTGTQPLGTNWANLKSIEIGANQRASQFVMPYSADRIFYRRNTDGGWNGYVELYHTGNLTNNNQLSNGAGYLTSVTTITGNAGTATILKSVGSTTGAASTWNPQSLTYQAWGQAFINTALGVDSGDVVIWLRAAQYPAGGVEACLIIDGDFYAGTGVHKVLHAGNYNSYALPLGGGLLSGTLNFAQPVGLGFANGQYIKDNGAGGLIINSGAAVNINGTSVTMTSNLTAGSLTTSGDSNFGPDSGGDNGIRIRHGSGGGDYGRIRFMQSGTNNQTIHAFSTAWQGGSFIGASAGAININGVNGVTFGGWNQAHAHISADALYIQAWATPYMSAGWNANSVLRVQHSSTGDNVYIEMRNRGDYGDHAAILFTDNNTGGYLGFRTYAAGNLAVGSDCMIYGTYNDHIFQAGPSGTFNGKGEILRIKLNGNLLLTTSENGFGSAKSIQIDGAGGALVETRYNGTSGVRFGSGSDHSYHHDPRNVEMRFATSDSTRFYIYGNGNYSFTGSNVSDRRAKENIFSLDISATDKIMSLQAKTYNMKNNPSQKRYGFIAQDVREILSDLVIGNDNDGYLGLDYDGLLSVAIKALQEQNIEIQKLKNK